MKKILLIINGPAYGADETFNAVRLAVALSRRDDVEVKAFLMGDGVSCAVAGQSTPEGYYTLDRMLRGFARRGGLLRHLPRCPRADSGPPDRRGGPVHHGGTRHLDGRS